MKEMFLKISFLEVIFTAGFLSIFNLILGYAFDYKLILLTIFLGAICISTILLIFKLFSLNSNRLIANLSAKLNEGEQVNLEGIAVRVTSEGSIKGKLMLTTDRMIYINPGNGPSCEQLNLEFSEIIDIKVFKKWDFLNKGLNITYKGGQIKLIVDYPKDWKSIVDAILEERR